MARLTRPAMFASTARASRRGAVTARTNAAITRVVSQQMQRAGLGALRGLAGQVAADVAAEALGEFNRIRRGGASAALRTIGRGVLGGVGKAISWLVGGQRGASGASPADVRAAREIVAKIAADVPMGIPVRPAARPATSQFDVVSPIFQPGTSRLDVPPPIFPPGTGRPEMQPEPSPASTGRGGDRGGVPRGGVLDDNRGGGDGGNTGRNRGGDGGDAYRGRGGPVMIPVHGSSNVHSFGYDSRTATLYVTYLGVVLKSSHVNIEKAKNTPKKQHIKVKKGAHTGERAGPGATYAYFGVPAAVFNRMRQAASKGVFIWDEIRVRGTIYGHKYPYRLATPGRARVPGAMDEGHDTISYVPRRATKKGLRQRSITVASGQTIYSNMSKFTGRRAPFRNR